MPSVFLFRLLEKNDKTPANCGVFRGAVGFGRPRLIIHYASVRFLQLHM